MKFMDPNPPTNRKQWREQQIRQKQIDAQKSSAQAISSPANTGVSDLGIDWVIIGGLVAIVCGSHAYYDVVAQGFKAAMSPWTVTAIVAALTIELRFLQKIFEGLWMASLAILGILIIAILISFYQRC
jgi:hypothetical protein